MGGNAARMNRSIAKRQKYKTEKRRCRRELQGKYNVSNCQANRDNAKEVMKEERMPKTNKRIAEKKARNEKLKEFKASQNKKSTMDIEK